MNPQSYGRNLTLNADVSGDHQFIPTGDELSVALTLFRIGDLAFFTLYAEGTMDPAGGDSINIRLPLGWEGIKTVSADVVYSATHVGVLGNNVEPIFVTIAADPGTDKFADDYNAWIIVRRANNASFAANTIYAFSVSGFYQISSESNRILGLGA